MAKLIALILLFIIAVEIGQLRDAVRNAGEKVGASLGTQNDILYKQAIVTACGKAGGSFYGENNENLKCR